MSNILNPLESADRSRPIIAVGRRQMGLVGMGLYTGVMDYDEAYFMHLTPGVVHNFPKAVDVWDFCPLCTKRYQIPIHKEKGATPGILVSRLNNRW